MATKDYLSHDELQHIEHVNKILQEHLELVNTVCSLSEEKLGNTLESLRNYSTSLREVQVSITETISNIYKSSRELKHALGGYQELQHYVAAVHQLNQSLDEKMVEKLRKIAGG